MIDPRPKVCYLKNNVLNLPRQVVKSRPLRHVYNLFLLSPHQAQLSSVEDHADVGVLEVVPLIAAGVGPRNLTQQVSLKSKKIYFTKNYNFILS